MNWLDRAFDAIFAGGLGSAYEGLSNASDSARQTQRKKDKGKLQGDGRENMPEWLQQYASMGVGSDGQISSKAIGNGAGYSNTQLMDMQYNHDEAQLDRDWNEQMYLKYQSPDAQMRQYQEAGLNPALMYGGVDINGPSGGSSASTSSSQAGEGPQAGFERVMGVISSLMQLMNGSGNIASTVQNINTQHVQNENQTNATLAEVGLKSAQEEQVRVQTNGQLLENELKKVNLKYADALKQLEVEKAQEEINNLRSQREEMASRISLNNSEIELNGHRIQLVDAQMNTEEKRASCVMAQTTLTNLEADKVRLILPYVQAKEEAELNLTYATTDAQKASASKALADADLALVNASKEQKLIDAGYCDEVVSKMKMERRTGYVDCIAGNIANIINANANMVKSGAQVLNALKPGFSRVNFSYSPYDDVDEQYYGDSSRKSIGTGSNYPLTRVH